jgi:two-component sensor histidine kinase
LKKLITKIASIGSKNLPLSEQRVVSLINMICSITGLVTVLITFLLQVFTGFNLISFLSGFFSTLFFFLPIYLNFKIKHNAAKWLLVYLFNQVMLTVYTMDPYAASSWIVLIALFPLYVALFSRLRTILILSAISFVFISSIIYFKSLPNYVSLISYTPQEIMGLQIIYCLTAVISVVFLSYFAKSNLHTHKERLEESLNEKDALLKEVHHRVKNNLQVMSSLFNIQSRRLDTNSLSAEEIINTGQSRIQSMALVHQQLSASTDLKLISLAEYIANLVEHIQAIYHPLGEKITFKINAEGSYLDMEKLMPVGLIINEMITNSIKYAFLDHANPQIKISCKLDSTIFELEISDNGIGCEPSEIKTGIKGIGTQIIVDMARQLGGKHIVEINNGVKHNITFTL